MTRTPIDASIALRGRLFGPTDWPAGHWWGAALQRFKALRPPVIAAAPRDVQREAAAVREMAYQHLTTDPGFAADLFAAADRHERMNLAEDRG